MHKNFIKEELEKNISIILSNNTLDSADSFLLFKKQIIDLMNETALSFQCNSEQDNIYADYVIIEAVDKTSGKMITRNLPLTLIENCNALRLIGETVEGNPSEIVFLSDFALGKLSELTGNGQDKPKCKE